MDFSEWEPTYRLICEDLSIDPASDEASVRLLEAVTPNLDLDDEDAVLPLIKPSATVLGASDALLEDIASHPPEGTVIAAGSACRGVLDAGIIPDILVTDLDGDINAQLEASSKGTVTLILAHGDNSELVARYAPLFRGKVVLTTQNRPHGNVLCFGGFTDGDRAVCLARHFGIRRIILLGFDFDNPSFKDGSDPAMKARKLRWAEKIIDPSSPDIIWPKH